MAEKATNKSAIKKRAIGRKPEQTVRERSNQAPVVKKRLVRATAKRASTPFRAFGRLIAKIIRPLRFLLWPFKTRPAKFVGRTLAAIFFLRYFRNAWQELKGVTWPTRKETWQLTSAVFIFAVLFGVVITAVDYGLEKLFKVVFLK